MITKCPACKKEHDVLWPDLWAYKRRNGSNVFYYCSWKCLRTLDRKGEEKHMGAKKLLTEEQEKHAIWLAISGEDPRPYLKDCGSVNPQAAWNRLRNSLKAEDPETFAKLPGVIGHKSRKKKEEKTAGDAMEDMQKAADEFFGACEDMGLKLDKEPAETEFRAFQPEECSGMTVREVEGLFGRYRRSDVAGATYIDFEVSESGEVLSYTVNAWASFWEEYRKALDVLGVKP